MQLLILGKNIFIELKYFSKLSVAFAAIVCYIPSSEGGGMLWLADKSGTRVGWQTQPRNHGISRGRLTTMPTTTITVFITEKWLDNHRRHSVSNLWLWIYLTKSSKRQLQFKDCAALVAIFRFELCKISKIPKLNFSCKFSRNLPTVSMVSLVLKF